MNKTMKKIISVLIMLVFTAGVIFAGSRVPAEIPVVKEETAANTNPAPAPVDLESVSIEGMNAEAYQVTEVGVDADGNYYVFAHGTGYNESVDIELRVAFDENHNILNIAVMNQEETNGLGSKITDPEFLAKFEGAALPVSLGGLKPKNPAAPKEETTAPAETEPAMYVDGTYVIEGDFYNGYKDVVTVVIEGGKIASVGYNAFDENGGDKETASKNGQYVMTEDGPLWHEQIEDFTNFIVANQGTSKLALTDAGKTDAVASVSIYIAGVAGMVDEAIAQAVAAAGTVVETPEVQAPAETPATEDVAATTVDAITNATISSKAFGKIVNNAFYFMQDNIWK